MFTIKDYNLENCTFEQLTEAQKIIIIREDILRIAKKNNEVILLPHEVDIIISNRGCFADIIKIDSVKDVYDTLTEEDAYQFIIIK